MNLAELGKNMGVTAPYKFFVDVCKLYKPRKEEESGKVDGKEK